MLRSLLVLVPLCLSTLLPAQATLPTANPWTLTQGNGQSIQNAEGKEFEVKAEFTGGDNGTYQGTASVKINDCWHALEKSTLTFVAVGVYNYENATNQTFGVWILNPAGYYDTWSSWNGGTTRRAYPPGGAPTR